LPNLKNLFDSKKKSKEIFLILIFNFDIWEHLNNKTMGLKFNNTENFLDQEVTFTYEGEELVWNGDYNVHSWGENPDYDYPGDCEVEIEILHTDRIEVWSDHKNGWVNVDPTPSILCELEWAIEKSL
jgi:hypothetical protein